MSKINISELGYEQILGLLDVLNYEKDKIIPSRINELKELKNFHEINRNYEDSNDIKNNDIPKEEGKLSFVENVVDETKSFIAYFITGKRNNDGYFVYTNNIISNNKFLEEYLDKLINFSININNKTNLILKDVNVDLTNEEIKYIIDKYGELVDLYLEEKNDALATINEIGDPKDDEDAYLMLKEADNDFRYNDEKEMESAKILNYAQCYLPNEKKL